MADTITDKAMQGKPAAKDRWFTEAGARGEGRLMGRITPSGQRRFYFRYTDSHGKQPRLLIGPYDQRGDGTSAFTVQQARDKSRELSALYRHGVRDLRQHFEQQAADAKRGAAETRAAAEERDRAAALERQRRISVRDLSDRWAATELKPQRRADGRRSGRTDGGAFALKQFERHVFPSIGAAAAEDVRRSDLMAILDAKVSAGKLRTATMLLGELKQMFRFALARDLVQRNPLDTVTKRDVGGADVERERVLRVAEIEMLAKLLPSAGLNRRTELAVWIALSTGCRIGELMGAVWSECSADAAELKLVADESKVKIGFVDLDRATWHLPDTKNEREHTIHLSEFALQQFRSLAELREAGSQRRKSAERQTPATPPAGASSPWVFPNAKSTGPVCVKSFGKQLADRQRPEAKRMTNRSKNTTALELPGGRWTAHDLRRTTGTLMASLGISGDVIDECLNHKIESRVRRTYIRDRRPVEQARAFDALGARLNALLSPESGSVVRLFARSA